MSMLDIKMPTFESEDIFYAAEKKRVFAAQAGMFEAQADLVKAQIRQQQDQRIEVAKSLVADDRLEDTDDLKVESRKILLAILKGENKKGTSK